MEFNSSYDSGLLHRLHPETCTENFFGTNDPRVNMELFQKDNEKNSFK